MLQPVFPGALEQEKTTGAGFASSARCYFRAGPRGFLTSLLLLRGPIGLASAARVVPPPPECLGVLGRQGGDGQRRPPLSLEAPSPRRGAGFARRVARLRWVKGSSEDPGTAFPMERTRLPGCWLCLSAPGDGPARAAPGASLPSSSSPVPCPVQGMFSQLAHPAKQKLFFVVVAPFPLLKTLAFFISSRLVSSPTSLGFNCKIPQFSKQISPDKTQTFEANCNLVQLKL